MFGYAGWYSIKMYREILFFIPFQQLFLIGPVLFFYTKSLLNMEFKISKGHLIHFLPALLYLLYSLIVFVTDKLILDEFYFYADGRDKDLAFWYQMAGLISMLFYLFLSLRYYSNYRKFVVQEVSYANEILFKWINHYMIAFAFILILRVLFFIINPEWGQFGSKYWYYVCFSILYFFIAIAGYSNTVRLAISFDPSNSYYLKTTQLYEGVLNKEDDSDTFPELAHWKSEILVLIKDKKVYSNPNLSLTDVALQLNTNRNIISSAINKGFDMNFNDFINSKRVEAVIDKIIDKEHARNTLLAIALDCGFNSKATFNRAFKKHTLLTPKQYIAQKKL